MPEHGHILCFKVRGAIEPRHLMTVVHNTGPDNKSREAQQKQRERLRDQQETSEVARENAAAREESQQAQQVCGSVLSAY